MLKEHFAAREARPIGVVAAEARSVSPAAGVVLLEALGRALRVDPGKLRAGDRLDTLFADRRSEPAADPRCRALLSELGGLVTPQALDRLGKTISPEPRTDAEWLNVMLGLRVGEWVRTWAPAVAESSASRGGTSKRERAFLRE